MNMINSCFGYISMAKGQFSTTNFQIFNTKFMLNVLLLSCKIFTIQPNFCSQISAAKFQNCKKIKIVLLMPKCNGQSLNTVCLIMISHLKLKSVNNTCMGAKKSLIIPLHTTAVSFNSAKINHTYICRKTVKVTKNVKAA